MKVWRNALKGSWFMMLPTGDLSSGAVNRQMSTSHGSKGSVGYSGVAVKKSQHCFVYSVYSMLFGLLKMIKKLSGSLAVFQEE